MKPTATKTTKTTPKPMAPKPPKETRKEATDRVTALAVLWLWRKHARAVALEVGVHTAHGLTTPWRGRYRADVVGVVEGRKRKGVVYPDDVHLVEVKGTRADLTRERLDLAQGERVAHARERSQARRKHGRSAQKWEMDYAAWGIRPWLAIPADTPPHLYAALPASWGVLAAGKASIKILRSPKPLAQASSESALKAWRAVAQVGSLRALPRMTGRFMPVDKLLAALAQGEFGRKWQHWYPALAKLAGRSLPKEFHHVVSEPKARRASNRRRR